MMRFLFTATTTLLFLSSELLVRAQNFNLTILHMNDHHSHLAEETFGIALEDLPESIVAGVNTSAYEEITVTYGGLPRLVSLFDLLEATSENPVLRLHAGDAFSGTLFFTLYEGQADAEMLKFVCLDAMTLGNHEFDNGNDVLERFIRQLQNVTIAECATPVLAANIVAEAPLQSVLEPYVIKEFDDGQQVAIVGIATDSTALTSSPDVGTEFGDPRQVTIDAIAELEGLGINKIILQTHTGFDQDIEWAVGIPGVDVVVGGHTHTLLGDNASLSLLQMPSGPYPFTRESDNGTVCVVQAWEYGHGLGELVVEFDDAGNVVSCTGGPKFPFNGTNYDPPLDEEATMELTMFLEEFGTYVAVEPDSDATSTLDEYSQGVEEFGMETIAFVSEGICYERIPGQGRSEICSKEETANNGGGVCNLVAQAFLDQAITADIAIQNGGGCRSDIFAGDYTVGDAFVLLPFANTMTTVEMTGAQIVQVLNDAIEFALDPEGSSGAYPYAAGIRFDADANADFPNRLSNVEINIRLEEDSWSPIDEDVMYTVVTTDFLASGGDGYIEFTNVDESLITNLYLEYAITFIQYAEEQGELVDPPIETYSTQNYVALSDGSDVPSPSPSPTGASENTSSAFHVAFAFSSVLSTVLTVVFE